MVESKTVGEIEDESMEMFVVHRDNGPSYKFRGKVIGGTESSDNSASSRQVSTGLRVKLSLNFTK